MRVGKFEYVFAVVINYFSLRVQCIVFSRKQNHLVSAVSSAARPCPASFHIIGLEILLSARTGE